MYWDKRKQQIETYQNKLLFMGIILNMNDLYILIKKVEIKLLAKKRIPEHIQSTIMHFNIKTQIS